MGCLHADRMENNRCICPFCRTPAPSSDGEWMERIKERAGGDDAEAIYNLGCCYNYGRYGLRQNRRKAMKSIFGQVSLGTSGHIAILVISLTLGKAWKRIQKKPNITMRSQL